MVKIRLGLAICTILLIHGRAWTQEPVEKIVPLESKKTDVVKILGQPARVEPVDSLMISMIEQPRSAFTIRDASPTSHGSLV